MFCCISYHDLEICIANFLGTEKVDKLCSGEEQFHIENDVPMMKYWIHLISKSRNNVTSVEVPIKAIQSL